MYKKPDLNGFMGDLVVEKLRITWGEWQLYISWVTRKMALRPLHLRLQTLKIPIIGRFDVSLSTNIYITPDLLFDIYCSTIDS